MPKTVLKSRFIPVELEIVETMLRSNKGPQASCASMPTYRLKKATISCSQQLRRDH